MKKIAIISGLFSLLILVISCDKVKNPIVVKNTAVGSDFVTKDNSAVSGYKKTLLEDYTGMRCPNCPDAAVTATNLAAQYGSSLVVIAVHTGPFAKPIGNFINQDYRTDSGDIWGGTSGFLIPSYPNGIINRKNYASNGLIVLHTSWSSVVSLAKNDPFIVKLNVTTKYDTTVKALNTQVKATFQAAYSNSVSLTALLIEDGIVGKQDIHGVETEDYDFEHVVRGTLNGDWGQVLKGGSATVGDTASIAINNIDLKALRYNAQNKPISINDKNVSVVVIAFDTSTREVLQVEKVKIR